MKLVALWLSVVIVTSCSITHRSGEFACTKSADCTDNRVCSEGFCVVPNGATLDAPGNPHIDAPGTRPDAPNGNSCPPGCSSCDNTAKTCTIECGAPGAANCGGAITCPTGYSCNIDCKNSNNCRSGIDCTNASACKITCSGASTCRDVQCGDGPCDVECTGVGSCRFVDCNNSCRCDINCIDQSTETCAQGIACGQACTSPLGGCTSSPSNLCSSICQ